MNNYLLIDIPKRSLKKIGRKIVLEQMQDYNNLTKYQIIHKYLYLTSIEKISKKEYSLYDAELCTSDKELIYQKIKTILPKKNKNKTFAINVERRGEHKFTSTELARELAGSVFDLFPDIKVDLKKADLIVHIKVLNNKCLIYPEQQ